MNYFNRLLKRTKNNALLDIKPAITPDSILEIPLNRPKFKGALTQTDDFVNFSINKSQQASKVRAQPSPDKYTEKQKNSDLSDKKTELLNDVQDILLQPELNNATTRSDETGAATEQDDSSLKERPTAKSTKDLFSSSLSLSSPSSDQDAPFSAIKQKQTDNDYINDYHPNHQYQSAAPATNSNNIEKQNTNIKPHHYQHHQQTINKLNYFSEKIKPSLVQGTLTPSSLSSSSSLDDGETLPEQKYQNLHLISPHLQTDSLKKDDKTDFLISSKRLQKGDFIVTDIVSNHKDEIFYPEVKKPLFPITQGGRSRKDSKNQTLNTIITINIGKIEVRNSTASDSKPNLKTREKFSPPLSLEEYLKQRSQKRKM